MNIKSLKSISLIGLLNLSLYGCGPTNKPDELNPADLMKEMAERYVTGVLKSEHFGVDRRFFERDRIDYSFSFVTEDKQMLLFEAVFSNDAEGLNALVDEGDTLTIELNKSRVIFGNATNYIGLSDVVKINGLRNPLFKSRYKKK